VKVKQAALVEEFLGHVRPEYHGMFRQLAEYACSLGYRPVKTKTKDFCLDFRSAKAGRTLMKMEEKEQKHGNLRFGQRDCPGLRLRFFASLDYSALFHEGVLNVIEEFNGRYTGCYGCGHCKGEKQGYTYLYPDGRKVFRCGLELVSVFDFTSDDLPEFQRLMKAQADFDRAAQEQRA
jgi:hypothetical protein